MFTQDVSLWHVTRENGQFVAYDSAEFSTPESYLKYPYDEPVFKADDFSHFKHGWTAPGREYGDILANLLENDARLTDGKPITILPAPYRHVPAASSIIARYLWQQLAFHRVSLGAEPPRLARGYLDRESRRDYTKLNAIEREKMWARARLSIDVSLISGAHVLVVNDMRVSGATQRHINHFLGQMAPASIWNLHVVVIDPKLAETKPSIDSQLNLAVKPTLDSISGYMMRDEFALNMNVLNVILRQTNLDELEHFFRGIAMSWLEEVVEGVVANGPAYMNRFPNTFSCVRELARTYSRAMLWNH